MKRASLPIAAALLAMPQAAWAAEPLCDALEAYAAAQWREPTDPAPRYWAEFHWGFAADSANRWSWACRDSGHTASTEFCGTLMADTSPGFQAALPFTLLKCLGDEPAGQGAAGGLFLEGEIRRRARDGSWVVLEIAPGQMGLGENAVRISFDSDDRRLDPERLPAIRPYEPEPEALGDLK